MTSYYYDDNFDREVERFSPIFSSDSTFEIHPSIFQESTTSEDEEADGPPKKRAKTFTPVKVDAETSMHGTLTPEQAFLIEINRKRAIELQKSSKPIRDMEETLKELKAEAVRLQKPISLCFDLTSEVVHL